MKLLKAILFVLTLYSSVAQAAVNYLVLNGTASAGFSGSTPNMVVNLTASISTSCPSGANISYYGFVPSNGEGFLNTWRSINPIALPSTTFCIAGVPSNLTLTSTTGAQNITLAVGGGGVVLGSVSRSYSGGRGGEYAVTSGIVLPDSKIIALIASGIDNTVNGTYAQSTVMYGIFPASTYSSNGVIGCAVTNLANNSTGVTYYNSGFSGNGSCSGGYGTTLLAGPNYLLGY